MIASVVRFCAPLFVAVNVYSSVFPGAASTEVAGGVAGFGGMDGGIACVGVELLTSLPSNDRNRHCYRYFVGFYRCDLM